MEIKYPLTKLLAFALGGLMGCVTVAISAYDHRADGESPSFHFYASLLLAAVNLLLAIDLSGYDYDKWNLVRALECYSPSPLFKYEDD